MAYDSHRDRIVMVGGLASNNGYTITPQETWEFDGVDWHLMATAGPIANQYQNGTTNVRAYYDSQRQATIAVETTPVQGGQIRFLEWTGTSWVNAAATPHWSLPWRWDFDVAYDPIRGVAVIFGGTASVDYGDTWEFDGTDLVQVSNTGPPPRWGHAMAFDEGRGVVVLHGGRSGPWFSDMWDWDGNSWQPSPNGTAAGPRSFHGMVYDRARSRLVLFGESSVGPPRTYEWQPLTGWTLQVTQPEVRANMGVIYDGARDRVVSFGGSGWSLPTSPTETFGYGSVPDTAAISSFGTGCPGPAGVPHLQANSLPVFGTALSVELSNLPAGPVNVVFTWLGFDNTSWNGIALPATLDPLFPGCTAYMSPDIGYTIGLSFTGTNTWDLAIPFIPAISGEQFYLQGGVLVLGYNPGGLVFSNALAGTLGR